MSAPIVLSLAGLGLAISLGTLSKTHKWVNNANLYEGKVTQLIETRGSGNTSSLTYAPEVEYVRDAKARSFVSSVSSSPPRFKVGETVVVLYSEVDQKEAINTWFTLYGFSTIGITVSSIATIGSLVALLTAKRKS